MNAETLRLLHDYNRRAHRQVWACIEQLTDDQFVQESDYSLGSVRNQVVHVMAVDQRWLERLKGATLLPVLKAADFPTRASVRATWDGIEAENAAYFARVTDAELAERITYDLPHRGGIKHNARWEIAVHMVNHGTDHRAQILALLHRLGAPTIEQDLMFYLWDR